MYRDEEGESIFILKAVHESIILSGFDIKILVSIFYKGSKNWFIGYGLFILHCKYYEI